MSVKVGVGYIDIKPDLSGFGQRLRADVGRDLPKVGREMSQSLGKSLSSSAGAMSRFTGELGGAAGALKAGFAGAAAVAGSQIIGFAADAVEAASSVNEALNATKVVFGEAADGVIKFAEGSAQAVGISKRAALEASSTFGNLLQSLGATPQSAAEASTSLIRLAADVASLYKIPGGAEAVSQKFMSGLVGETEPLRALGIVINEQTVKQKALELGIGGTNRELTEGEKLQARYALIVDGSSRAQGDFAKTSDTLANAQLRAAATMENARATLGDKLIPVVTYGTLVFIGLTEKLTSLGEAAEGLGSLKVLGVDLGQAGKNAFQAVFPVAKFVEWLHQGGEAAAEATGSLGAIAKTITLAGTAAVASQKHLDDLKTSLFGLTDAQRAQAQASRAVAQADQALAEAKKTLNDLLRDGAVDEEKVVDARKSLAAATRSAASAGRDLADAQEEYNEKASAARILGTDTANEEAEDAADALADATDSATSANERAAEAQKELQKAQAGDPEFQDKLAAARRRVGDATFAVSEAEYNQARAAYQVEEATKKANTQLAVNGEAVAKIRGEWELLLAKQPDIMKFLAGPLGLLPAAPPPAVAPAFGQLGGPHVLEDPRPAGLAPGTVSGPTTVQTMQTVKVDMTVLGPAPDPALLGKAIAWAL